MPGHELDAEIAAGVQFWGYEADSAVLGIMGIQPVREVDLIRHAYVLPGSQRLGVGAALLEHLRALSTRRMLVGTWAAASWAIRFYRRHGFELVSLERKTALLGSYWTIPDRQIEASVVLANPPFEEA
jgi:GNAT superfamily N-acetyltransferase